MQNIAGYYGTGTDTSFASEICNVGTLCVKNGLTLCEGYEEFGIRNGNTYYFNAATSGVVEGLPAGKTGIYAFNSYDVNKVTDGEITYNLGAKALNLILPAGERGAFTELLLGEKYAFGEDSFSAIPEVGQYATIADGAWTVSATAPTTSGEVYAKVERIENVNEANTFWGYGYVLEILRVA